VAFLRNTWYVAAWSKDIGQSLTAKRYLNEPVLLFRKENGDVAALADRCPHRFAPLSSGKRCGDIVQCGYHGLEFNAEGRCVRNPHGDHRIPKAAVVKTYPVIDRHALIWIWMGDPSLAEPSLIPDMSFLADKTRATMIGSMVMNAHYELLTDNLMDLSHGQYVHASFIKEAAFVDGTNTVLQEGNRVHSNQWVPNGSRNAMYGDRAGKAELYDQWWDIRWDPPGVMVLDSGVTLAGTPRANGEQNLSGHMVTPETDTTTHYFYSNSRDYEVDNEELNAKVRHWQAVGFHEQDHPMIESVQRNMGETDLLAMSPVLLAPDAGAVRVRRVLAKLIEDEQACEQRVAATV